MQIVIDAGPLYALFDRSDKLHVQALGFLKRQPAAMATTIPVLTEVAYSMRKSPANRGKFLTWAHAHLEIDGGLADDLPRIVDILAKYHDLRPDFADATLVALCERIGTRRIATIDSDFDIYRTLSNEPFENVLGSAN